MLTLRVVLGAVGVTTAVEGDDLVAEDVLASGKALGDSDGPGVVLANHLDGSPLAVLVANTVDLGPLELLLLDGGNVASVGSDVGDDRADVALGPGAPVELNGTSSGDLGHAVGAALGAGGLVADDVGITEGVGLDEAVVEVLGVPADVLWHLAAVLLGVVVVEAEALLEDTVDGDAVDNAVGSGGGSESRDGAEGGNGLVHVD